MNEEWQARVRTRAYELWEKDASPDGNADHYWHLASRQLQAEGDADATPVTAPAQDQSAKHGRIDADERMPDASDTHNSSYLTGKAGL